MRTKKKAQTKDTASHFCFAFCCILLLPFSVFAQEKDTILVSAQLKTNLFFPANTDSARLFQIEKDISADNALFTDSVILLHAKSISNLTVLNSKFARPCLFYYGEHRPNAGTGINADMGFEFRHNQFIQLVDLRAGIFSGDAVFEESHFENRADFSYSDFKSRADFYNCYFHDSAHFALVHFRGDADFSKCRFSHVAFFYGMSFDNLTDFTFTKALFPDTLDLSENGTIFQTIDLTDADFSKQQKPVEIYLAGSDISKIHLDYTHFHLLFRNPHDHYKEITDDEKQAVFEELLNNFKSRGQLASYRKLDIEYQDFLWDKHSLLISWFKYVPKLWWNYGYDKWLVFLWAGLAVIIFTLINSRRHYLDFLNTHVYTMEGFSLPPETNDNEGEKNVNKSVFWYAFVYTSSIFFKLTLKLENLKYKETRHVCYIIMIYTLGLICLAYMANFVIQK